MKNFIASLMFTGLLVVVLGCGGGGGGSSPPRFSLTFDPPGASGYAGGEVAGLKYAASQVRDFNLSNRITVTGQVTDGAGAPLANVDVALRVSASGSKIDSDTTDPSGNYSLTVGTGTYIAEVDSNTAFLGELSVGGITVTSPGPVVRNFQFPSIVSISGSVFESDGTTPISNAIVEFTGQTTDADASLVANGSGAYSTSLVPDTYEVVVTPAGAAAATHLKQKFTVAISGTTVRNFTLAKGITVSGTVFRSVDVPYLESTDIEVILPGTSSFYAPADVSSNELDGSYTINLVPLGRVTFELDPKKDSGFPLQQFSRTISGPAIQTVDFILAAGFVLSGTILQDDGVTPEEDVEVEPTPTSGALAPKDDDTDEFGFYEISLFAGTYNVQITPDDPTNLQIRQTETITVSGNTTLDVTLTRGAILSGTIFLQDGTTPAPDVDVAIANAIWASDTTDDMGAYSFLAPVGTHTLNFADTGGVLEDFALTPLTGVVVTLPGPVTQNVTLSLATAGTNVVTGVVFAPDGITPVAGVTVEARDSSGDMIGMAVTDVNGYYTLVIP